MSPSPSSKTPRIHGRSRSLWPIELAPGWSSLIVSIIGGVTMLAWAGQNGFKMDLLLLTAAYALIALGMYVPFVLLGKLSLAYGAYAAIGAYAVALVASRTEWPLFVSWLMGAGIAAVVAVILGMATMRLTTWFLAAVTILFSEAFQAWLFDSPDISGGAAGISDFRTFEMFGWTLTRTQSIYAAVVLVLVIGLLTDRLRLSAWGVTARTVREESLVVETSGVRVNTLVLIALAFGAAIACFGGSLFATSAGAITPETFTLDIVFLALFMPLIGGVGTPWGAVLGAALVVQMTLNLSSISSSGTLILAVGVLVMLLVAPNGLLTLLDQARRRISRLLARRYSHAR